MLCCTNSTEMGKQPITWENITFRIAELGLFVSHLRTDSRQYAFCEHVPCPQKYLYLLAEICEDVGCSGKENHVMFA